jgi:hypothetical protein
MYEYKKHHDYYICSGYEKSLRPLHYDFGNIYADRTLSYNSGVDILRPIVHDKSIIDIQIPIKDSIDQIKSKNKKIILLFSGGLDSTLVLAACVKYNIDIYVTLNRFAVNESPQISIDIASKKYKNITPIEYTDAMKLTDNDEYIYITGEIGDQIVGTDRIFAYMFYGTLYKKAQSLYKFISDESVEILEKTSSKFINLDTVFDLLWWLNFNFKYQNVQLRSIKLGLSPFRNVIHFFDTDMFNSYAINTIKQNYPKDKYEYKKRYKEFIEKTIGYGDFLKYKQKEPSLKEIL